MKEIIKSFDKPSIRIRTKEKVPLVFDWVNSWEPWNISCLLEKNGEYGLRTGTKIGNYYFCVLDLDSRGWTKICRYLSYVKTSKGIHIYCLVKGRKPPKNYRLFCHKQRLGEFCSKGRQVVGAGSKHPSGIIYQWVDGGKWFWKFASMEELKEKLGKYEIELK